MQVDRRIYPRVSVDLPAEIDFPLASRTLDARITNLSLTGVLVEGDIRLVEMNSLSGVGPIEFDLHFGLDGQPMHCRCRVVYKRREGQQRCSLGLSVLSIPDEQRTRLADFINQRL